MNRNNNHVLFSLEDMYFEYDINKNNINIQKHGISFEMAARVFLDYDRIEMYDEEHSYSEDRFNTIGSIIGGIYDDPINKAFSSENVIFVVYTEKVRILEEDEEKEVIRLISARMATGFERGLYYGKFS